MYTLSSFRLGMTSQAAFIGVLVGMVICYAALWVGLAGLTVPIFACLCMGFRHAFRYQLYLLKNSRHQGVCVKCAFITLATHTLIAGALLSKKPSIYSMGYGITVLTMLADYRKSSARGLADGLVMIFLGEECSQGSTRGGPFPNTNQSFASDTRNG
ncbi:hypothetical protein BSKO_11390 [Bryopsis sp. KO-2023]|nr:hypothetical protein BSKO_11390 [Bryopsis sp. KO-2023]